MVSARLPATGPAMRPSPPKSRASMKTIEVWSVKLSGEMYPFKKVKSAPAAPAKAAETVNAMMRT